MKCRSSGAGTGQGVKGMCRRLLWWLSWSLALLTAPLAAGREGYTLATYPFGSADQIYQALNPLAQYLQSRLEQPVRLVVTRDYRELAQRLSEGSVDLAWIGSANYVRTFDSAPDLHYIATYQERAPDGQGVQPYYQSVILTLDASPYQSLAELADTRFGFTDPDSTSGHAFARLLLHRQQLDPGTFFSQTYFLGTHRNVIEALRAGSIHAGAVSDGTYYNALADGGDGLRALAWSDPIPLDAFVAAAELSSAEVEQVRAALLAIGTGEHPVNRSIRQVLGWPAAGFTVKERAFYAPMAEALATLPDSEAP